MTWQTGNGERTEATVGSRTCVCAPPPPTVWGEEPPAQPGPRSVVAVQRPAAATEVPALRRIVRQWALAVGLDEERAEDLVLAADEAISNVVDHAYPDRPGTLRLLAGPRGCGNGVVVSITDEGSWRPPGDPGTRGRGLLLIRNLADRAHISHTDAGTTVRMCWAS